MPLSDLANPTRFLAFADRILHADETTWAHTGDEHLAFLLAEVGLAALGKDRGDRAPFAGFDAIVNVLHTPAEPAAQGARHGRLAGAHEPDKINLVRVHARSDSSTEKNSG